MALRKLRALPADFVGPEIVAEGVRTCEDRSISVPMGAHVIADYVDIDDVRLACKDRMAVGDVDRAYQRRLQLGSNQPWPPPRGYWEKEGTNLECFVIVDGRHDYVAALMLGQEWILVAWVTRTEIPGKEVDDDYQPTDPD